MALKGYVVPSAGTNTEAVAAAGSFSIIKQSMALNCFPRVTVVHKSSLVGGQIYIEGADPFVCARHLEAQQLALNMPSVQPADLQAGGTSLHHASRASDPVHRLSEHWPYRLAGHLGYSGLETLAGSGTRLEGHRQFPTRVLLQRWYVTVLEQWAMADAEVNWALCLLGIAIICGFTLNQGTPTVNTVLLSNAYGVAVLAVMVRCLVMALSFQEFGTSSRPWPQSLRQSI